MTRRDETTLAVANHAVEAMMGAGGEAPSSGTVMAVVLVVEAAALARHGHRLLDEGSEAWPEGPRMPSLWIDLAPWGHRPIGRFVGGSTRRDPGPLFDPRLLRIHDDAVAALGPPSGWDLPALLHGPDAPWTTLVRRGDMPWQAPLHGRLAERGGRGVPFAGEALARWARGLPAPLGA